MTWLVQVAPRAARMGYGLIGLHGADDSARPVNLVPRPNGKASLGTCASLMSQGFLSTPS